MYRLLNSNQLVMIIPNLLLVNDLDHARALLAQFTVFLTEVVWRFLHFQLSWFWCHYMLGCRHLNQRRINGIVVIIISHFLFWWGLIQDLLPTIGWPAVSPLQGESLLLLHIHPVGWLALPVFSAVFFHWCLGLVPFNATLLLWALSGFDTLVSEVLPLFHGIASLFWLFPIAELTRLALWSAKSLICVLGTIPTIVVIVSRLMPILSMSWLRLEWLVLIAGYLGTLGGAPDTFDLESIEI
jgi:hypothetical protein